MERQLPQQGEFKQGQLVIWSDRIENSQDISGIGTICGMHPSDGWIVDLGEIHSAEYPYRCAVVKREKLIPLPDND